MRNDPGYGSPPSERPPPFLDKLVSSAHLPRASGSTGFYSTRVMPDLTHTAIATRYCPVIIPPTTPLDYMTKIFRQSVFVESSAFERPIAEGRYKKAFFKRAHNVFFNKVLCELDSQRKEKSLRHERIWTEGKRQLGFPEDSFLGGGSISSSGVGSKYPGGSLGKFESGKFESVPVDYLEDAFESETVLSAEPATLTSIPASMPVLKEDDEEYNVATLLYENGIQITPPSPLDINAVNDWGEFNRTTTAANNKSSSSSSSSGRGESRATQEQHQSPVKHPSLLLESISQTLSRASTAASSSSGKRRKKTVSKQRQRQAFNRMTFFECLLDNMHVPEPKVPRYGQLPSPIRVSRVPATAAAVSPQRIGTAMSPNSRALKTRENTSINSRASTSQGARLPSLGNSPTASGSLQASDGGFSFGEYLPTEQPILPVDELTLDDAEVIVENSGLEKWTIESVKRCLTGDKPSKPKLYQ